MTDISVPVGTTWYRGIVQWSTPYRLRSRQHVGKVEKANEGRHGRMLLRIDIVD